MTYPDVNEGLTKLGFFGTKGRKADKQRDRLTAIGMSWFNQCQNDRSRIERQWALNLAFFYGNQYVAFKSTQAGLFDLYTPNAPYYRVRIVINQIRAVIRKEISRLTAQKPNAYIIPSSTEDSDVFAAQAGEQIWDSLWRRLMFNKTLREAIFWQSVTGNGFIKTGWDPTKQDPESDVVGDIILDSVTPWHIFVPDLLATDIENQPYVIHAQVKPISWVRQNLGVEQPNSRVDAVDDNMQTVMGVTRNTSKKDQMTILEIWVKPGYLPELPKGGMFTIAGNQIVQGFEEWPYEHLQYPFCKLDAMPTGKFYNASIIEDLIPIQKELNRSRSQLIESKNRMSKPQLVAVKGSVDPRKITTEPGQVIEYNPGFDPPQPLPMQNLPSYVTEEINRLYTDISDISGQHEVSKGSTPPGVTAATAISFLQEQDETLIANHYTSVEEAIEKAGRHTLSYAKMYWDENRTIKVVGIDGTYDVLTFKGADLRGNTDIRIEAGSALPTSRAAKQALLMDLMKMGFIPPEKGLEMMEIGGINKIYEEIQVDRRQAQRENQKMRVITEEDIAAQEQDWEQKRLEDPESTTDPNTGLALTPPMLVPTNTWDNHQLHIEVHNLYRKSQSFENASPLTRRLFEEHVNQHQEALAGMMQHPLTGMDPSDPNAPDPEDEENTLDAENQQEDTAEGNSTGPVPMPQTESDAPPEGM